MAYLSDIEIAQQCEMQPIAKIAQTAHIDEEYLEPYGKYKAKVDYNLLDKATKKMSRERVSATRELITPVGSIGILRTFKSLRKTMFSLTQSTTSLADAKAGNEFFNSFLYGRIISFKTRGL